MTKSREAGGHIPETLVEGIWSMWSQIERKPRLRMVGASMSPLINEGDTLLVDPQPKSIRIGDVVIYRREDTYIAHRLIAIQKSKDKRLLILKGDNVLQFDPPLPRDRVIGKVLGKESASGLADYTSRWWLVLNTITAVFSRLMGRCFCLHRTVRRLCRRLF